MVVENKRAAAFTTWTLVLQMNRGEWPSIPFDGWKPRIFRTADEDSRWLEYKAIQL
jgi:hypothetical protein